MLVAACLLPEASAQLNGYRRVHSWGSNRFGELGIDHVEGQASQAKENQCDPQFVPTLVNKGDVFAKIICHEPEAIQGGASSRRVADSLSPC